MKKTYGYTSSHIIDWIYSYTLDLSCPNRKRLEVSENVKYIAVTSRALKLQVSKVWPGQDLNPGLPCESISLCQVTHAGGPEFPNFGDL